MQASFFIKEYLGLFFKEKTIIKIRTFFKEQLIKNIIEQSTVVYKFQMVLYKSN